MPKKIDPRLRDRAVRLVREHWSEYPSLTAASAAVARQVGVGHETMRRLGLHADVDDGTRDGVISADHAEIKRLKAENKPLREDVAILKGGRVRASSLREPQPRAATRKGPAKNLGRFNDGGALQPLLQGHRVNTEIFRDLLDRHIRLTASRNMHHVVTELSGIRLRHNNIHPAHALGQANSDVT